MPALAELVKIDTFNHILRKLISLSLIRKLVKLVFLNILDVNFHCLSGTFCTLDICISRLEEAGSVDVRGTVEKIRSQRAYSIQMPDQYVFCHLALLEHAISKNLINDVDMSEFHDPPSSDSD